MRVRLVALLGSLALLAILGAPTLAMSLREHLPTAPWQWTRGAPFAASRAHQWTRPGASDEAGYLARMVALHEATLGTARQLTRTHQVRLRELADSVIDRRSGELARMETWLHDWYPDHRPDARPPGSQDPVALVGSAERQLLRHLVGEQRAAVVLSEQLLVHGLVIHPAVARLAAHIRDSEQGELQQLERWLSDWSVNQRVGNPQAAARAPAGSEPRDSRRTASRPAS